jgi:hypothetical protein
VTKPDAWISPDTAEPPPAATLAIAELFQAHYAGIARLAAMLGADDPEDVAQEAFARLYRRQAALRDPDAALAYVRAIVCNLTRADVAKIVVKLAGGRTMQATCPSPAPAAPPGKKPAITPLTTTCTALPGAPGGARVFAIQLPQDLYRQRTIPQGTATAYNAAGEALATISLGTDWHP